MASVEPLSYTTTSLKSANESNVFGSEPAAFLAIMTQEMLFTEGCNQGRNVVRTILTNDPRHDNSGAIRVLTLIHLRHSPVLGQGSERRCYLHPTDDSKVIKVAFQGGKNRKQNRIESVYYQHLLATKADLSMLAGYFGQTETDLGPGLIFERVCNHDGSDAVSLLEALEQKRLSEALIRTLLERLAGYLHENSILFVDVGFANILLPLQKDGSYRISVIDGIGSRHPGFKFFIYRHCRPLRTYKIRKQLNVIQTRLQQHLEKFPAS